MGDKWRSEVSFLSGDNARPLNERKTKAGLNVVFLENKLADESFASPQFYAMLKTYKQGKKKFPRRYFIEVLVKKFIDLKGKTAFRTQNWNNLKLRENFQEILQSIDKHIAFFL